MTKFVALGLLLFGCANSTKNPDDEVRIGLLLPYTGKDGSAGANYERGVLMAADHVNAAGGLHGKSLRIVYADTHSSVARGLTGARELLERGVVAIIGPEDDELARALSPMLAEAEVALLTPSSSSVPVASSADVNLWFRLAPSGKDLGVALGRQMTSEQVQRVAIVHTAAEYEVSFAGGVEERLNEEGATVQTSQTISASAADFTKSIRAVMDTEPDAIVLAADVITGSRFVNDFAFLAGSSPVAWYLSPSLEHEDFVLNTLPRALEGMVGVSAAVTPDKARTSAFTDAFVQRWKGATPTTGSFYYYDALALFSIAFQGAAYQSDSVSPMAATLRDAMLSASGQSGLVVTWDQLQKGVDKAGQGQAVYYSGVTGVISLDRSGARSAAYTRFWTIRAGDIVPLGG